MYVCVCHAVSEREIQAALDLGAESLEDLSVALGVGTGCGKCRNHAQEMVAECRSCRNRHRCGEHRQ